MAGDDLVLKAIIESALDSQGFDEFKTRLGEAAAAANKVGPGLGNVAEGVDRVGKRIGSVGLNILTSQLLASSGAATGFTRILASGAATVGAYTATLGPWGLALAAAAAAGAAVASKMQQKRDAIEKAAASADKLRETDGRLIDQLEKLKMSIGSLPPALETLLHAKKALNDETERGLNIAMIESLFAVREQIRALEASSERLRGNLAIRGVSNEVIAATNAKLNENAAALQKARLQEAGLAAEIQATRAARAAGMVDITRQINALEAEAAARERGFKSLEAERRAKEALRKIDRQAAHDAEVEFRRQRDIDAKNEKAAEDEAARSEKLARIQDEQRADDIALEIEVQQAKRAEQLQTFNSALGLLAAAFPKNKALAIAQAIINTYEGATAALKIPPPAGIALAIATIAFGLAQVAKIREAEPAGFDLAENDALAQHFGRKWAADALHNIGRGFYKALGTMGPAGGVTHNIRNTTINSGPQFSGGVSVQGMFGATKTDLMKRLNRELIRAARLERRSTIG